MQIPARDPDGDPITYTVDSVTPAPTQLRTISSTGLLTWTQPGPLGSHAIVVKMDDGRGVANSTDTATLNVDVQSAPPNNPPQILTLTLPGPATEAAPYRTTILTHDPDGDPVTTFSLDADSLAKGITIDTSGVINWTPTAADAGAHTLIVTATDSRGAASDPSSFALSVQPLPVNDAPQILTSGQLGRATEGVAFSAPVVASDPDGDPITLAITAITPTPTAAPTINAATGVVDWASPELTGAPFTLTVVVTDAPGLASDPVNLTLDVVPVGHPGNNAPMIDSFSYSPQASVGSAYELKIPAHDPDGDTIAYSYELLDSGPTAVTAGNPAVSDDGLFVWDAPTAAGIYTLNITVTDTLGAATSFDDQTYGRLTLTVIDVPVNNAPVISTTDADMHDLGPGPATKDDPYQVQIEATDSDGDAFAFSATITAPDQTQFFGADFTIDAQTGLLNWNAPTQAGQYSIDVTVDDGRTNGAATKTLHVDVADQTNRKPIITTVQTEITNPVANVDYVEQIRAYDPDNNPITFSIDTASVAKGIAIDKVTGRLTWSPATSDAGAHNVTVSVTDNKAAADPKTHQLTVGTGTNSPPNITSSAATKVTAGQDYRYDVNATDADGDPIKYVLDSNPAGMVINATTGVLQWSPSVNDIGLSHAVKVKAVEQILDGSGGFADGQFDVEAFSIKVVSDPNNTSPTITSTPKRLTTLDRLYGYNPVVSDPDDSTFVWTLAKKPDGMVVDRQDGRIRWQPKQYQVGDHEVILRVSDLRGGADTQTFTVTVRAVNNGPSITSSPEVQAVVGNQYLYRVKAQDPEGDKVLFVVTATDPNRNTSSVPAFDVNNSNPLSIDDQGVIRWKPQSADADAGTGADQGVWTINIVAKDELGKGTRQIYELKVVQPAAAPDKPPVITSSPSTIASVNSIDDNVSRQFVYAYQVIATDPDNDDSAITYAFGNNNEAPAGMTINASTGAITWEPTLAQLAANQQPQNHYVTVEATSNALKASQRYRIRLRRDNSAPEFVPDWPTQVVAGQTYRHDLNVDDADRDPLEFKMPDNPSGMTMDQYGRITWTTTIDDITKPNASGERVRVTVTDPFDAFDGTTFFITVVADKTAPTVDLRVSPGTKIDKDKELSILVTAVDDVGVESITVDLVGAAPREPSARLTHHA